MEHYTWDEMEKEVLSPTIGRKIITGDKAMVAQVFLAKGAVVPEHHHESEQITYILEGALEFHLEGKTVVVSAGQVLRMATVGGAATTPFGSHIGSLAAGRAAGLRSGRAASCRRRIRGCRS